MTRDFRKWSMVGLAVLLVSVAGLWLSGKLAQAEHAVEADGASARQSPRLSGREARGGGEKTLYRGELSELPEILEGEDAVEAFKLWARAALAENPDPSALWASLLEREGPDRQVEWTCRYFLCEWAAVVADAAIAAVAEYVKLPALRASGHPALDCGSEIAERVAPGDREKIWAKLLGAEAGGINSELLAGFLWFYLKGDVVVGVARFNEIPSERRWAGSESRCVAMIARQAPAMLPQWFAQRAAERQTLNRGRGQSQEEALQAEIREGRSRMAAEDAGRSLAYYHQETGDLETVLRVLPHIPEPAQRRAVSELIAGVSPAEALESFRQWQGIEADLEHAIGSDLSTEVLTAHVRRGAGEVVRELDVATLSSEQLTAVATAYAKVAPAPAFDWARGLPQGEDGSQALERVTISWAHAEPMAASRAVAGLAAGPQRDRVQAALQEYVAGQEDAELAERVGELLGSDGEE